MKKSLISGILFLGLCVLSSNLLAQGYERGTREDEFDDGKLEQLRNDYWYSIRASGDEKDINKIELATYNARRSMENRGMFKVLGSAAWQPIAGSQEGHNSGRARDIAFDPQNPNIAYVASASGGIWKTNDITASPVQWIDLSGGLPSLRTTAIAVDPGNSNTIYVGTGEPEGDGYIYLSSATVPYVGLLKSVDGGLNWTVAASEQLTGNWVSNIIVDNVNNNVYAACANGLVKSSDGGNNWKKIAVGTSVLSLTYNSKAANMLYASGNGKIFVSSDYGETWTQSKTGLPSGSVGRITVACAPSAAQVIYASIGTTSKNNGTYGIWKSDNSGASWRQMYLWDGSSATANPLGTQQWWCNALTVRSNDAKRLFVGGLDIYTSSDSGKSFSKLTDWTAAVTASNYAHADIHKLIYVGNSLYACTDGGLARTTTASTFSSWQTDINAGLSTLQFVGADADKNFTFVSGGCQDNSTNRAAIAAPSFTQTRGGDGGRGWVSPEDPNVVFTTYISASFYKSLDGGNNFTGANLVEGNAGLYRNPVDNSGTGEGTPVYATYDCSPTGSTIAYSGSSHVWVSINGGDDHFARKSDKAISARVNGICVYPQDDNYMWAGSNSNVFRTTDQGTTWVSTALANTSGYVSGVICDPNDRNKVFAVCAGISTGKQHFFKSTDGGVTFTAPATNFPNISCNAIAYRPEDGLLFIGTDGGVLYSYDGGVTWNPLNNGFPLAQVTTLRVKGAQNDKLLASTYGRGLFWLDLSSLSVEGTGANQLKISGIRPNPVHDGKTTLSFSLATAGIAEITLYDVLGREVKILNKNYYAAGDHSVELSTQGLTAGEYVVTLVSSGKAISQKIIIE